MTETTLTTADLSASKATFRTMNRAALLERLAQIRHHIAESEESIVRLHEIMAG